MVNPGVKYEYTECFLNMNYLVSEDKASTVRGSIHESSSEVVKSVDDQIHPNKPLKETPLCRWGLYLKKASWNKDDSFYFKENFWTKDGNLLKLNSQTLRP